MEDRLKVKGRNWCPFFFFFLFCWHGLGQLCPLQINTTLDEAFPSWWVYSFPECPHPQYMRGHWMVDKDKIDGQTFIVPRFWNNVFKLFTTIIRTEKISFGCIFFLFSFFFLPVQFQRLVESMSMKIKTVLASLGGPTS